MEDDTQTPITPPRERPLGYWLRALDARISERVAAAFEAGGIGRREWMLLNVLSGDVPAPGFAERLARRGKKLRSLADRGWVTETDGTWTLTDEGRAAKDRLSETITAVRDEISGAVSPEDFATTMTSLETMARQLGWDEQSTYGHGRRGFGPGRFGGHGFGPHPEHRHSFGARHGFGPEGEHGFDPRPGFDPRDGFGPDGEHGFGRHGHGMHAQHGCGGGHGRHARNDAEQAYERGFRAGFGAHASDTSAA
ncbi:eS10 family ribosomal protein [Microbacterium sp. cx-55]|uniref:MarR family winged helix-turn-helix transcriptional regulator n=1 Tax=Microbacterium sp. cx-55 TaxID=2875948 RepID=UPI001CC02ABE|nr:eS10 family ribosomal protein [Microbacterium sp. cx-55]MBZ4488443.1 eS10 family ribosomal protein [Microbacterium sp. cx-55]UGB35091.1 eS10 family ribosomal protein [Microbacterium sp. cx-55]